MMKGTLKCVFSLSSSNTTVMMANPYKKFSCLVIVRKSKTVVFGTRRVLTLEI